MPIETAIEQAAIEDSLVSDPPSHVMATNPATGELSLISPAEAGFDVVEEIWEPGAEEPTYENHGELEPAEPEEQQENEGTREALEDLQEFQEQRRNEIANQLADEQLQQAQQTQTPAGLEEIDGIIAECKLDSPERLEECAAGLCSAIGLEQGAVNPGITNTLTRAAISVAHVVKDEMAGKFPQGVPPVNQQGAQLFSNEFVGMLGGDARLLPAENQQYLTQTNFDGLRNMIFTANALGWPEDPSQVNDAQMAAHFMGRITAGFGGDPNTVDVQNALKTVDWLYRDIVRPAVMALSQRQPAPREASQRQSQQEVDSFEQMAHLRGQKVRGMKTNQDLFDREAMGLYQLQHGRF